MNRRMSVRVWSSLILLSIGRLGFAMPMLDAYDPPGHSAAPVKRVCPGKVATGGADVSSFNVGNDWKAFARTGRGFGIVKASEGLSLANRVFAADWTAIKKAGLVRGAYHFFHADRDPVAQAKFFVKTVGSLGAGDLAPILDWEILAGRTVSENIAAAQAWLNTVEAATKRVPIIYTSAAFFDRLGNPKQFARYPLFVANYDVSCPRVPAPWTTWSLWQYAATGTVPGIVGAAVDQDLFNGTWAQLNQFAR